MTDWEGIYRAKAIDRTEKNRMNKTEKRYADYLELQKHAKEIVSYKFEVIKFVLGYKTTYLPDFMVLNIDGTVGFDEVKGFWRDDARVKIKTVARMFPEFRFRAVQWVKGSWEYEDISP